MDNMTIKSRAMRRVTMNRDQAKLDKGFGLEYKRICKRERRCDGKTCGSRPGWNYKPSLVEFDREQFELEYELSIRYKENGLDLEEAMEVDHDWSHENELDALVRPMFNSFEDAIVAIVGLEDMESLTWAPSSHPTKPVTIKRYGYTLIGWRNKNAKRWHDASRALDTRGAIRMMSKLMSLLEAR